MLKNRMAIIGKILTLNKKSDNAKDITKGVVTCERMGAWFNNDKMVITLKTIPKMAKMVAALPAK